MCDVHPSRYLRLVGHGRHLLGRRFASGRCFYIATETTSELKKGGYVQSTVILMLRKRSAGDNPGFKQKIPPAVRREVEAQIKQMLHLNEKVMEKRSTGSRPVVALPTSLWVVGEPVFNDSDLKMAGYAAALKVLTG